jgi:hypothetical protein
MSGRAGRRGLDDRGIVILIIDEKMGADVGKGLLRVSSSLFLFQRTTHCLRYEIYKSGSLSSFVSCMLMGIY